MVDGFKIKTTQYSNNYWIHNSGFDFLSKYDEKKDKAIVESSHAQYNGLFLSSYIGRKNNPDSCHIRGSLARFHNKGSDNAFDFTMDMVRESMDLMENSFDLDLEQCDLRGLEVGFNINLPIPVSQFLGNIKQINDTPFSTLKEGRFNIGLIADKQEYSIKLYDKGKVASKTDTNLLRMELNVSKTRFLQQFGIHSLIDLKDNRKIKMVALSIVEMWSQSIYIESNIQYKKMTNYEQKKWLYLSNPTVWDGFKTRMQKNRAKKYYNRLISDYCKDSMKAKVTKLMLEKIEFLTTDNCIRIIQDSEKLTTDNCIRFIPLDEVVKRIHLVQDSESIKTLKTEYKKEWVSKPKCKHCKKGIVGKRKDSKYCGSLCKEKHNGMRKAKLNRERIKEEKKNVAKLVQNIPKSDFWLNVSYREKGNVYSDNLHQSEIHTTSEWTNKVVKVEIESEKERIELNGIRAKQFIRKLNTFNLEYEERKTKSISSSE